MLKYTLKRIILLIPTIIIVLTVVFFLMRLIPGSPVQLLVQGEDYSREEIEELETQMGFNDPIWQQYLRYMGNILTGDWGESYFNGKQVFQCMMDVWEPTLMIAFMSTILTVVIAIPIGILSATHRNSPLDYFVTSTSVVSMSIPSFCWSLLLCYFLSYKLGWFRSSGYVYIEKGGFWNSVYLLALPCLSLGLRHVASLARYTRSTMLDVLNQDYIRTAKAKGLPKNRIYYKHALKNTLSIVGTMVVGSFAGMLGGTAVTEKIFNIRGMGTLAVNSLTRRDYNQEQAIVLFTALICLGVNLLMDLFYKLLDPRIEYE